MNIYSILRSIKKSPKLGRVRKYLNLLYYDPDTVIINYKNFDTISVDGCQFYVNDQIDSVQRVKGNPWFEGVRPSDTVLDIGANIGAITIPLAKVARKVYAVEPLFADILCANVQLNRLKNVEILPVAIGLEESATIEFSSRKARAPMLLFGSLIETIAKENQGKGIDFIKIDGEGCEWDIEPEQLSGIREIRIEFHLRRGHKKEDNTKLNRWMDWFYNEGYDVHTSWGKPPLCVPFTACLVLRATKRESHENK